MSSGPRPRVLATGAQQVQRFHPKEVGAQAVARAICHATPEGVAADRGRNPGLFCPPVHRHLVVLAALLDPSVH